MKDIYSKLKIPSTGNAVAIDIPSILSESLDDRIISMSNDKIPTHEADFMLLCADNMEDLKGKCNCLNYVRYDGMLWIALPEVVDFEQEINKKECYGLMQELNLRKVDSRKLRDGYRAYRLRPYERAVPKS